MPLLLTAATTLVALFGASPFGLSTAGAQPAPATTPPATGVTTTTTLPVPTASTARTDGYGAPRWLPLRRDKPGNEVVVGCTYDSHGSQHGYECSGHHGRWAIDFIADRGTPVYAAGPGFATDVTGKPGGGGFGNVIRIDHGFGVSTVYAHLDVALLPPEGKWVDETTLIGTIGQTGSASTPHLHFEERLLPSATATLRDEVSVDPGPLFACRGDLLVAFPQVAGFDSWKNLPWGSLTVASDGHDCVTDRPPMAKPAVPIPAPTPRPTDETSPWSDLIAPIIGIIGGSADRLIDLG